MKKVLAILLALIMVLSLAACGGKTAKTDDKKDPAPAPQNNEQQDDNNEDGGLPEIKDSTEKVKFADYCFKVNGKEVKNADLEGLHIYKISVSTTNSKGVTSDNTYCGYKLADVLAKCGIENAKSVKVVANDGYESTLAGEMINSDYTLVAIEKDKEVGQDGTIWIAPCESTLGNVYSKLVVELKAE